MMGMQTSLIFCVRQTKQMGFNPDMKKTSMKRLSKRQCFNVFTFSLLREIQETALSIPSIMLLQTTFRFSADESLMSFFSKDQSSILVSLLLTKNDPEMFITPASTKAMFDAGRVLLLTQSGKKGTPLASTVAGRLSGLTNSIKSRFQTISPILNITTANALILLRSLGNCVHRQLSKGMAAIRKQVIGITIQNIAKEAVVNHKLRTRGDSMYINENNLIEFLQPINLEKGLAKGTVRQMGRMAHRSSLELVVESMCQPCALRQEQKQILLLPQIIARLDENLMRAAPMRVILACWSARVHICFMFQLSVVIN